MTYNEEVKRAYRRYLNSLAIYRFCQSDEFKEAYEQANETQLTEISTLIDANNIKALKSLIFKITRSNVDLMSFRDLRAIAKRNYVPNYSRMDKDQLKQAVKGIKSELLVPASGKGTNQDSTVLNSSGSQ